MTVIVVMVIASLVVAGGFLAAFIWAVRSGQYDDTYTPAVRILFDQRRTGDKKIKQVEDTKQEQTLETLE